MRLRYTIGFFLALILSLNAQSQTLNDEAFDDVMLQGFWGGCSQDSAVVEAGSLYQFLNQKSDALAKAGFDVLWLPPSSKGQDLAYFPTELYNFNNDQGSEKDLKTLLNKLNGLGMHAMADVVVNHRNGTKMWSDFTNPDWGCEVIVQDDEVDGQLGQVQPCGGFDEGEGFEGARDMDHRSAVVQKGYKEYLDRLKALGFDSWRWDFVKGIPAKYFGEYNAHSKPYFSVGENWEGNPTKLKQWVDASAQTIEGTTYKSASFDFGLFYHLKRAFAKNAWFELDRPGLISVPNYSQFAVTFVQNHDVYDIKPKDYLKANAYILTHNGIPMVFIKHWLQFPKEINTLIQIRRSNGIHAKSVVEVKALDNKYAAIIDQKVALKMGEGEWAPQGDDWVLNLEGEGFKVWSKIRID